MVAEDEGEQGALARTWFGGRQLKFLRNERGKERGATHRYVPRAAIARPP